VSPRAQWPTPGAADTFRQRTAGRGGSNGTVQDRPHTDGAPLPEPVTASPAPIPAAPPARRRPRRALWKSRTSIWVPLIVYGLFTVIPFYWMLLFAFRRTGSNSFLPWPLTLAHFRTVWYGIGFATFFRNSVYVAVATLLITVLLSLLTGYALARYRFRGKSALMFTLLATQFIPGAMLLIPLFVVFRHVGLINNLGCLIVADTVFQLPLSAVLMSGFIRDLPVELEEAAMMDGCSRLRAFRAVLLPLLKPAIVATGSFAFIGSWNNFLFALMFMSRQDQFTVPVGLSYTLGEYNVDFGALAAGGVVAAVPVVLVFAVAQRWLVQGLSTGAVKG